MMPGIGAVGKWVYIAVGDCLTIMAGTVGTYLARYLDNSDTKMGSAKPRPIVPPRNFRKGIAEISSWGVMGTSGSAYLTE